MSRALTHTRSTCCYCGTGCGVIIHSIGDRIVGVEGDPDHPANFGKLCTKGNTLHLAAVKTGRATVPMLRETRDAPVVRPHLTTSRPISSGPSCLTPRMPPGVAPV